MDLTLMLNNNERLQQILSKLSFDCRCESCLLLAAEKDDLKQMLEELKQTQAYLIQSEKMAALGILAAGLFHEINNPIGVLINTADVSHRSLKKIIAVLNEHPFSLPDGSSHALRSSLEALRVSGSVSIQASERIAEILKSMRCFVDPGDSTLKKIDLNEMLESLLTLFKHEMNSRITVDKLYGDIPAVPGSAVELNQVFINILQNAVQAIREKGTITIRTSSMADAVCIQIADTGVGMSQEQLRILFDPGFSRSGTRVKASLGLFISLHVIQKHGGQIEVKSREGEGSVFSIVLPKKAHREKKGPASSSRKDGGIGRGGINSGESGTDEKKKIERGERTPCLT